MKILKSSIIFCLVIISHILCGQTKNAQKVIIKDLSHDWLAYDDEEEYYLPIVDFFENTSKTRSLYQNFEHSKSYYLTFSSQPQLCLYINNQLIHKFSKREEVDIPISEILDKTINHRDILLTFFHPKADVPHQIYLTYIPNNSNYLAHADMYKIEHKKHESEKETLIISFFVFIGLVTYLKYNSTGWFDAYFDFSNAFFGRLVEDHIYSRVMNSNTFIIFIVTGVLFNLILKLFNLTFLNLQSFAFPERYQYIGVFAIGTLYIVIFLVLKYLFLSLVSSFLKIGQFFKRHYFESIRMYLLILLVLFFLALLQIDLIIFYYFLGASFIFWLTKLGFLVKKEVGFRKIYLFSYLCASEIIPVVFLLKQITTL